MGNSGSKPRKLGKVVQNASHVKPQQKVQLPSKQLKDQFESGTAPEEAPGKDGMDPQADQGYIRMMNSLGKQIHSHNANHKQEIDVRALKQLLKRKQLHDQGQNEVQAQMAGSQQTRTMVHPRTLTAVVNALHDKSYAPEDIARDYEVSGDFLRNMSRLRVADRVVIIEEQRRADEIGPKVGLPMARAATEPSMIDYDGNMEESVNEERIKTLKKRLE